MDGRIQQLHLRVPGEKESGKRVINFYAERELCLDNKYFTHEYMLIVCGLYLQMGLRRENIRGGRE